jgi:biotin carboxylase/SAM-dependent methyltransferase
MTDQTPHVVLVDGYSTGAFYPPLLRERGMPIVHVRSAAVARDATLAGMVNATLEGMRHYYTAMLEQETNLDELTNRLAEYAPQALLVGCETGVELADRLAQALGLPGNNPDTSRARRDKFAMHQALARAGLPSLNSHLASSLEELEKWIENSAGVPVVLKPAMSSGADGIHVCKTLDEARAAFGNLIGAKDIFGSCLTQVLAQEFAPGEEVVVNTVSCRGRHRVSDLWRYRKMITPEGRSVYDGAQLVADFGTQTRRTLDYAFAMLDALDIRFGPAHAEIMLTPDGPVLIECGARPMGASYPQELLKESVGHTQLELAVEAALEPDRFLENADAPYAPRKHFFIKCLVSTRQGSLDATPAVTLLAGLPSVRSGNFLHCLESDHVEQTVDLLSSPATLFLCHEDPAVLSEDHELITALESEGQNLLFEMSTRDGMHPDPDWFQRIPDDLWLKPESQVEADADVVRRALHLESGQDVLDCPCGDARFGQYLARHGVNYVGVDLNPRFIQRARQRFADQGLTGKFTVGDMRELSLVGAFDAVINWFNSFGYFDVETDFLVLKNLARSLRPSGMLLMEAPNRGNVIANTTPKFDARGKELQRLWDDIGERMYLPVPVEENGRIVNVLTGPRLYSLAQYKLFFRLAGLEFAAVYDERLGTYSEASKRMILLARNPR